MGYSAEKSDTNKLARLLSINPAIFQQFNNAIKRSIYGVLMISGFIYIISMGPIAVLALVLFLQIFCFTEVITIGYNYNKIPSNSLPYFRPLCWYFLIVTNYFFCIETVVKPHLQPFYKNYYYFETLVTYNRFFSFCIYFLGIMIFVGSLVRKHTLIIKQFRILAWTHTLLIFIVLQSYLIIDNLFLGLIWLILPHSLVIINDICAYVCGRLFGRTPLIELSPKKTWEGFIGGGLLTLIVGFFLSNLMCNSKYFICPVIYTGSEDGSVTLSDNCAPNYLFEQFPYELAPYITVNYYPFVWHYLALTFFASNIAPFGGFCASGFKRAFKIKDFGDTIPGHGGIMDRFDCQYLMGSFVNVYIFSFVRNANVDVIFEKFLYLDESSQIHFYNMLKDSLQANVGLNGVVNSTKHDFIIS